MVLKAPKMTHQINSTQNPSQFEIHLAVSDWVAPFTYLSSGKVRGIFSDNGFMVLPGKAQTITFTCRDTASPPSLAEFKASFSVKSLWDSYH